MRVSGCEFTAICLQETWLTDHHDLSLLQLYGYNLVTQLPSCSVHGGVCIYLKDSFTYKILNVCNNSDIWDGIFIEIQINSKGNPHEIAPHKKLYK